MITTLSTPDPDTKQPITVTVHWSHVPVTGVTLYRKDVEGNPRALNADVTFGPVVGAPTGRKDHNFSIELDVQTQDHEVRMRDGNDYASIKDLQETWKLASTSGGHGPIASVKITTILQ
jgi:hypothetical protein